MPNQPTGLEWLTQKVMPSMLQGMAGRWLLSKLFDILDKKKVMPPGLKSWLKKPVKEVEASVRDQISREDRVYLAEALSLLHDEKEEEVTTTSRRLALFFAPSIDVPDAEEVEEFLIEGSFLEGVEDLDTGIQVRAAVSRGPGKGEYPKGISRKGEKLWDEMIEDFEEEIERLGKGQKEREWAAAILIFQRLAKEERIRPFKKGVKRMSPHTGDILKRRRRLIRRMDTAYKYGLRKMQKFTKVLKEEFEVKPGSRRLLLGDPVLRADGEYQIRMYYRFDMSGHGSQKRKNIRQEMKRKLRFKRGKRRNTLSFSLRKYRYRLVLEGHSKDEWRMYLTFPLSESEAIFLTGERNKASILHALQKISKDWKLHGKFPKEMP